MNTVNITQDYFDPAKLAAQFRLSVRGAGAIASFTGLVRSEKDTVSALKLSHYPGMTEAEIERIALEAFKRWSLVAWHVTHRVGEMAPDDPIVFIAIASAYRRDAIEAMDFMMDYLKSEAPFWKQEIGPQGNRWVEPKAGDKRDIARWSA